MPAYEVILHERAWAALAATKAPETRPYAITEWRELTDAAERATICPSPTGLGTNTGPRPAGQRCALSLRRTPHRQQIGLALLEKEHTFSTVKFAWDPAKNASNQAKHGLSLAAVTALWAGPVLTFAAVSRSENCGQTPGGQQATTEQNAPRGDTFRLISARRSRHHEKILFQKLRA